MNNYCHFYNSQSDMFDLLKLIYEKGSKLLPAEKFVLINHILTF